MEVCGHHPASSYTTTSLESEKTSLKDINSEKNNNSSKQGKSLERENWSNKAEYLLALVGNAVGIGNIWRFPFQCKMHGGGENFSFFLSLNSTFAVNRELYISYKAFFSICIVPNLYQTVSNRK